MSVCTFIASDFHLAEAAPACDYPLEISIERGATKIYDGGADDNYFLLPFSEVWEYSGKKNAVRLEWNYYTEGRAERIIEYIKNALRNTDKVELWHVWLAAGGEFEDRPVIRRQKISAGELTPEHIREIDEAEIWNTPDKMYPNRPSFCCLEIRR